jgi:hypothetical protein
MFARRLPIAVFGNVAVVPGVSTVTFDAIGSVATTSSAQTISLNMTVGATANAMLISTHFAYSGHTGFNMTWTVGGTTQTLVQANGSTFDFILTSDNGASAPALGLMALLNPTPGAGTLTMSFTTAADAMVMEAATFNNVNTLGGISGAFTAANFGTGTSASASSASLPAVPGGIQFAFAGGISSSPTSWNTGTTLYKTSSGGNTWGSGAYANATTPTTFSLSIGASVAWDAAWVVVNPLNTFKASPAINFSSPLATGLVAAIPILGTGTLTDLISAKTATTVGGSTDTSGGYGGGWAIPASSTTAKADFGVWQPIGSGDFTVIFLANPNPGSGVQGCLFGQCDSGVAQYIIMETNSNNASTPNGGWMTGIAFNGTSVLGADDGGHPVSNGTMHVAKLTGEYHCFGMRVASGVTTFWCDGSNTTTHQSTITGTITNVSQHFAIGNLGNYTGSAFSAGCTGCLLLAYGRALSDADMGSITAQPFQVFQ